MAEINKKTAGGRPEKAAACFVYASFDGKAKVKTVPRPSSLATEMVTPCRRAISAAMARPRPAPSCEGSRVWWKRSKISGTYAAVMPGPSSATETERCASSSHRRTPRPGGVNFTALSTAIMSIWRRRE